MRKIGLMRRACLLADRASCGYKVGALVVKKGRVILEAWNETLPGEKYCQDGRGCIREKRKYRGGQRIEIVCSLHAEASLVAQAAARGLALRGAEIYVTTFPWYICAKLLAKTRIGKLYFMSDYGKNDGRRFFRVAGIEVEKILEKKVWERNSTLNAPL
jgi:deoxycytidylate deaminase